MPALAKNLFSLAQKSMCSCFMTQKKLYIADVSVCSFISADVLCLDLVVQRKALHAHLNTCILVYFIPHLPVLAFQLQLVRFGKQKKNCFLLAKSQFDILSRTLHILATCARYSLLLLRLIWHTTDLLGVHDWRTKSKSASLHDLPRITPHLVFSWFTRLH